MRDRPFRRRLRRSARADTPVRGGAWNHTKPSVKAPLWRLRRDACAVVTCVPTKVIVVVKGFTGSLVVTMLSGLIGSMAIVYQADAIGSSPWANSRVTPDTCAEGQMKTSFLAVVGIVISSLRPLLFPALVLLPKLSVASFPVKSSLILLALVIPIAAGRPVGGTPSAARNFILPSPRDPFLASTAAVMMCWMGFGAVDLAKAQFEGSPWCLGLAATMQHAGAPRTRMSLLHLRQFGGPTATGLGRSGALRIPGRPGRRRASRLATATSVSPWPTTRNVWPLSVSAMPVYLRRRFSPPRHSAWRP